MVYNAVTTFCHHYTNVVLQRLANHAPAVKLHWSNVVCHPWAIVVYNVEPTLDQRRNANINAKESTTFYMETEHEISNIRTSDNRLTTGIQVVKQRQQHNNGTLALPFPVYTILARTDDGQTQLIRGSLERQRNNNCNTKTLAQNAVAYEEIT